MMQEFKSPNAVKRIFIFKSKFFLNKVACSRTTAFPPNFSLFQPQKIVGRYAKVFRKRNNIRDFRLIYALFPEIYGLLGRANLFRQAALRDVFLFSKFI